MQVTSYGTHALIGDAVVRQAVTDDSLATKTDEDAKQCMPRQHAQGLMTLAFADRTYLRWVRDGASHRASATACPPSLYTQLFVMLHVGEGGGGGGLGFVKQAHIGHGAWDRRQRREAGEGMELRGNRRICVLQDQGR